MERIGFAQGSLFLLIKVDLKLFASVCLQLILPATTGSVKSKHHKNTTHGTAAHGADTLLSHFHLRRLDLGVDTSQMCFKSVQSNLASGCSRIETKVKGCSF